MLGPRERGIAGEDAIGLFRSFTDELGVHIREIDDPQLGDTRLPLAEELAGTTDREITFRTRRRRERSTNAPIRDRCAREAGAAARGRNAPRRGRP